MRYSAVILCIVHSVIFGAQTEVTYLFSHGLADSHRQARAYICSSSQKPYIIPQNCIAFDYPDVGRGFFKLNRLQTSLAQDNEIQRLAEVFFSTCEQSSSVVLVGVSRGASTIINFMGLCNPSTVSALVLESPFDCIDSIAQRMIHETRWGCVPGIRRLFHNLFSFVFCKYNPDGVKPIQVATQIRKDLPILIICSATDKLVPVWSSINLYRELKESGHEHTYLLILPEGVHGRLMRHPRYQFWYQNVTHAFYKKYGLPHDPACAESGEPYLYNLCQPSLDDVRSFYPHYIKKYRSEKIMHNKESACIQRKIYCT